MLLFTGLLLTDAPATMGLCKVFCKLFVIFLARILSFVLLKTIYFIRSPPPSLNSEIFSFLLSLGLPRN